MTHSDPSKTPSAATTPKPADADADADHQRDLAIEKLARKQARVGQTVLGPKT